MPTIFSQTIHRQGRDYRVEFNFDDEAIVGNSAAFEIAAAMKDSASDEWITITLRGEAKLDEQIIVLSYEHLELARLPINLPFGEAVETLAVDVDLDHVASVDQALGTLGIEQAIHLFPADPILGCLIKSAASTSVGQIIRCWYPQRHVRPFTGLARRIGMCLRDHAGRMFLTFLYRMARCIALAGLF